MERYIGAEKLEKNISKLHTAESIDGQDYFLAYDVLYSIRIQPTEDVKPIVRGEWIEHNHNGIAHIECSKCLTWFPRMYLTRNSYCPNCGADMRKESEGAK